MNDKCAHAQGIGQLNVPLFFPVGIRSTTI